MDAKGILITIAVIIVVFLIVRAIFFNDSLTSVEDATRMQTIDPSNLGGGQNNSTSNFTYSIWFYVDDWNYRYGEPKVIFGRMNSPTEPQFGAVLGAMKNDLDITVETFASTMQGQPGTTHTCNVQNIPLQTWVHLLVSVYGKSLDVYIDGKLVRTCVLPGVAKVNNNTPVRITPLGGFRGYTANFQFWPNATNPQEAYNIYKRGFGGSALGNLFNKYRIKFVFLVDNQEQGSFEI